MDCVSSAIKAMAEANPYAPAVISERRQLSFFELHRLVAVLTNRFAKEGFAHGAKVFLNFKEPDLRLVATIACLHYGLVPFIRARIDDLAGEMDYDLVIAEPEGIEPGLKADLVIDQATIEGAGIDPEFRDFGDPADEATYFIATTSGTTGKPKLVVETYGNFRVRDQILPWHRSEAPPYPGLRQGLYTVNDRVLITLGALSKYGFGRWLRTLSSGATMVRQLDDTVALLKAIDLFRVSHMLTTPATMDLMLRFMEEMRVSCRSVREVVLTGALFGPELVQRMAAKLNATIRVAYGSAELGAVAVGTIDPKDFKPGYVGEICSDVGVTTTGTREHPGPLVVTPEPGSQALYYSRGKIIPAKLGSETLADMGYLAGKSVFLVGRNDEVFNFAGNKVAFSTIETAVRSVPGVFDVGVVSGGAAGMPENLLIAVAAVPGADVTPAADAVCKVLSSPLAAPHLHFIRVNSVPRNAMGKVDRQKVADTFRERVGAAVA